MVFHVHTQNETRVKIIDYNLVEFTRKHKHEIECKATIVCQCKLFASIQMCLLCIFLSFRFIFQWKCYQLNEYRTSERQHLLNELLFFLSDRIKNKMKAENCISAQLNDCKNMNASTNCHSAKTRTISRRPTVVVGAVSVDVHSIFILVLHSTININKFSR